LTTHNALLPGLSPAAQAHARAVLTQRGVSLREHEAGTGGAGLVIAATGFVVDALPGLEGCARRPDGRLLVTDRLHLPARPEVMVLGDMAAVADGAGGYLRQSCAAAMPMGTWAGDALAAGGSASVRLDPDQLRALLAQIPDFPADTVGTAAPDVTLSTEFSVFGISIPVGISATPGAADGDLTLTPTAFDLGGNRVDADTLRGQLGGVADRAVQTWRLCIADRLPAGLTLDGVSVQGEDVVATFAIDGRLLNDPALQQNGTCG
jgi:hypothetical protein